MPLGGLSDVPLKFSFGIVSLGTDFSSVHFMQIFKCGAVIYHYLPELENILPGEQYRKSSPKVQVYLALATTRELLSVCKLQRVMVTIGGIETPMVVEFGRDRLELIIRNHEGKILQQTIGYFFIETLKIGDAVTINAECWGL